MKTVDARKEIIEFLTRELIGPAPGFPAVQLDKEEILRAQDPPRLRYSAGILADMLPLTDQGGSVLIDCVTLWVSNLMLGIGGGPALGDEAILDEVDRARHRPRGRGAGRLGVKTGWDRGAWL